jgi:pimeloyl-ACP methyl ester carboxylesterase
MSRPVAMEVQVPTIEHAGRRISYEKTGTGPLLVLLPPGASPAAAWRRVTERLAPDFCCIAVNPSGYGDTEPFAGPGAITMDDEAAAVSAIINHETASLAGPVHLVGHSYGGAIALQLMLDRSERFATLTLIEAAPYPLLAEAGESELASKVEGVNRRYIADVEAGRHETALEVYIDYYNGTPGAWSQLAPEARQRFLGIAETVAAGLAANHGAAITLADCATIQLPTLVVRGAETDAVHGRLSDLLAEKILGARFEAVAGAGHMLTLSHPEIIAGLIAENAGSEIDPGSS